MPAINAARRRLGALCLGLTVALAAAPAAAAPLGPMPGEPAASSVTPVQDRLLPRFFGNRDREPAADATNTTVRLDQLETQVRNLTGQVEQLTFALRRLEAAVAGGTAPAATTPGSGIGAGTGTGAPPSNLGTLPSSPSATPSDGAAASLPSGPVDLSALNRGTPELPRSQAPSEPVETTTPAPASSDGLSSVRSLYDTGRYQMAAQEAQSVLERNPSGPVAGEARFLLGEALLAQGEYREAANLFLENYTSDPNGSRAPASLLRLGTSLNGLDEREAACSSLEELFSVYPNLDGQLRAEAERERQAANCV